MNAALLRTARQSLACAILTLLAAGTLAAQTKKPVTVDDLLALKTLADPQLSPDGGLVAFTVSTASLADNRNSTKIWLVGANGGNAKALTRGAGTDRAPRWAPDGKSLAFISTRDGSSQVWRIPAAGGEPHRLTAMPTDVSDIAWAPDGKSMYLVSDLKWPAVGEVDLRNGDYPTDARIWTTLFYRHWNEWRAGRRQHVFRLDVVNGGATDITPFDRDAPTLALGGRDVALSPRGTELALVWNPDSVVATSTNNDILIMRPDGSSQRGITTNPANDHSPAYSPDGRYIAYLAMDVPGYETDRQKIVLYERATGRRIPVTEAWDLSVSAIAWLPGSRSLVAEVEERGEQILYAVEVPTGRVTKLVGGGTNTDVRIAPHGDFMIFLRQSATAPPEIYRADVRGRALRPITRINHEALAALDLSPLEPFGFIGGANDSVFGWLLTPPGFSPAKRYSLVYLVHGGPQSAWLDQWHPRWNYALFAARGHVVAMVNFHGSTGYGRGFTRSISRNWGGLPYEDLMKGLDILTRRPYVDRDRLAAAGASYGGYMIYWMAGHTNRFKALVSHDGVFNPLSMAGSTEELWFPIYEFGGSQLSPSARALMEKWSPANHIANWTTPMLIVHSQNDYRVDVSEGYQAFTALQLRGVPSKFLYFPDEDHWVAKPRNRRLWWGTVLDWLDTHLER